MCKLILSTHPLMMQRVVPVCCKFNHKASLHRALETLGCLKWKQPSRQIKTHTSTTASHHYQCSGFIRKATQEVHSNIRFRCSVVCRSSALRSVLHVNGSSSTFFARTLKAACHHQPLRCCITTVKHSTDNITDGRIHSPVASDTVERKYRIAASTRNNVTNLMNAKTATNSGLLRSARMNISHNGSAFTSGSCSTPHLSQYSVHKPSLQSLSRTHNLHTISQGLLQTSESSPTNPGFRSLHTVDHFTLDNVQYRQYLDSLVAEHQELAEARLKGENVDYDHLMFLESVAITTQELQSLVVDVSELKGILSGEEDKELQTLAQTDVDAMQQQIDHLQHKLVDMLVGPEPADKNDIMLEVSAGVGGQEAMLFTSEIFDMYAGYAYFKGWTFGTVDYEKSDLGGLRRASALITGVDVYKHLKFEAGVHRVQRVPRTERSGRIHTSTMTVAVLPQPSQIDISVNPKDLHIDTFRAGGAGGQHVNKTESAVRITHKPSGTVAECQQDRSQIKNRELAMKILLSRLYQKQVEEQETALRRKRKMQVGSAGRSEKIRTYNYSQDRITDHRGPVTLYGVSSFLGGEGDLEELLQGLMVRSRLEVLAALVEEFADKEQGK